MGVQSKYFPKCRKDAQCKCRMCVDSLNATRDLRPTPSCASSSGSASRMLNALGLGFGSPIPSFLRGKENNWPRFDLSRSPATPLSESKPHAVMLEPVFEEIASGKKKAGLFPRRWLLLGLVVVLLAMAEFVAPVVISRFSNFQLSPEAVAKMVEESRGRVRLVDRLDLLQRRIQRVIGGTSTVVSNCTGSNSKWTLAEEGALIHSYCSLYKSMAEQVSLWGYPIATAGVLGRRPLDRYMTVLFGRVFEWKEGQLHYTIHNEGASWTHHRWSASAIHLDKNTWVIEYTGSSFDKPWGGLSAAGYAIKSLFRSLLLNIKWCLDCFTFASYSIRVDSPLPT